MDDWSTNNSLIEKKEMLGLFLKTVHEVLIIEPSKRLLYLN